MRPSFAHFRTILYAPLLTGTLAAAGCASLPPPTAELAAARQAVTAAEAADADQYAPQALEQARNELQEAQAALERGRTEEARAGALAAAADGDLARVRSQAQTVGATLAQRQSEVGRLRAQLQLDAGTAAPDPLALPIPSGSLDQRLQALDADPQLAALAAYERLQARQAVAALATARRSARAAAAALAERRVDIAEQAARVEAARAVVRGLERERADLLVEASRRDAERARAEAERLRLQAQVQAEEAQRLQNRTDQVEAALDGAVAVQQDRIAAARAQEAELARKEAELTAGAPLPPMRSDARGDVYTLSGTAFASGQAALTPDAAASVRALGIYLAALRGGAVEVVGHTDSQGAAAANQALSERRAQQVRATLVAAGLDRGRVSARGAGASRPVADNDSAAGRARNRRVEIVVAEKR